MFEELGYLIRPPSGASSLSQGGRQWIPRFLLKGETGPGKEVDSPAPSQEIWRSSRPFVGAMVPGFRRHMIGSECSVHEKGAFTGPAAGMGRFEVARRRHPLSLTRSVNGTTGGGNANYAVAGSPGAGGERSRRVGGRQSANPSIRIRGHRRQNRDLEAAIARGGYHSRDLFYRSTSPFD